MAALLRRRGGLPGRGPSRLRHATRPRRRAHVPASSVRPAPAHGRRSVCAHCLSPRSLPPQGKAKHGGRSSGHSSQQEPGTGARDEGAQPSPRAARSLMPESDAGSPWPQRLHEVRCLASALRPVLGRGRDRKERRSREPHTMSPATGHEGGGASTALGQRAPLPPALALGDVTQATGRSQAWANGAKRVKDNDGNVGCPARGCHVGTPQARRQR